jgi:hypothetical protein
MNDLDFKLKEAKSELTAEEFMNEVERIYDGRTKEKRSLDKTESLTGKPKTAQDAANKAIEEIITEDNIDNFKDKDVLDKAIEYFEGLDDDFKNTLGANPIQVFIKAVKLGLKAIRLARDMGKPYLQSLKSGLQAIREYLKALTQKSWQELGMMDVSRSSMAKLIGEKLFPKVYQGENITAKEKSERKVGFITYLHRVGSDMGSSYNTGKKESIYAYKEEWEADLDSELTADEVTALEKSGVPVIEIDGKFYYDKSKAKTAVELGIDEEITIDGRKTTVLAESRKEQKEYKFWPVRKIREMLGDKQWNDYQQAKLRVLKNIAKQIETDLKQNPGNKKFWASWLNQSNDNVIHPIRALAPIDFLSDQKGPKVAEHALPANHVATLIMNMATKGTVNKDFKIIQRDYKQGSLLKSDDNKLKGEGYNYVASMPDAFFDLKNPTTWLRYVERFVNQGPTGGIDMNKILVNKDGKVMTLAESFGLKLEGKRSYAAIIRFQNNLIYDVFTGKMTLAEARARLDIAQETGVKLAEQAQVFKNASTFRTIFNKFVTPFYQKKTMENSLDTQVNAQKVNKKKKGISVFDLDGTLANTKEKVIVKMSDGTIKKISAIEFAEQADILAEQGAEFDFKEFTDVKGAKKGPLADLALRRQDKFGSGDIYVLTARPQASAKNIKLFLDSIGLNIPIENITGLEDGTSQAKANWVLQKTGEGYNDFYFADDSKMNVDAVKQILDQVDVKSKVQQAIADKETNLDKEFNEMLEESEGMKAQAEYSRTRAQLEGKKKDKGFFKWLGKQLTITPSAEDFMGLMYDLMGSGRQGNRHAQWIRDNLINPYNKAEQQILSAKVAVANDFAALKKAFPSLRSTIKGNPLMDQIGVGPYTKSQALRVYIWNKQGMEIPGLSKRDQNALVAAVEADSELNVFADEVILIQKNKEYPAPGENWVAGTIDTDIMTSIDKDFRRKVMTEFDENASIIFSEKNMYKLEAIYGKKWVDALKDSLRRMKSGSNRPVYQGGGARIVNEMLDWLNGSVGAVMFLNVKSGLLQLISNVNFINWGDNNIYAAAKAFASAEYWPTVLKLMNSDYLVNRRDGLKINVNEAELANAAKDGGMKGAIAYLLDKGFIITRIMDSLAIATGGATFYINRRNALLNRINPETSKKYTKAEAEAKAFDDFYAISEESQQSSNPSKISQQQASLAGRVLLAFQNVTMQYNRMTKKSIRDLYNRRKNPGMTQRESDLSNLSKIIYYTTVQNAIFNALQQALFALLFNDEGEEEEKKKAADIANGMLDSLLFGLGFGGAAISTVKNVLRQIRYEKQQKSPDYEEAVWEIFGVSPVLDSKVRKLRTTAKTFSWNMEEIKKRGWSLDNPTYLAVSQLISAATNIPIDRVLRKAMNLRQAMDEETRTWQRVALILGWNGWSVGLPYWGLQSTIKREAEQKEKLKVDYKNDIRKLKAQGYKKVMYRNLKDFDPKDIVELQSPAGTVVYYVKIKKKK